MQNGLCSRIKPLLLRARHILRTDGERAIKVGFEGAQHNLLPRAGRLYAAAEKCLSYLLVGPPQTLVVLLREEEEEDKEEAGEETSLMKK
jgi:hypothetical protein